MLFYFYFILLDSKENGDSDEFHKRILTTIFESWIVIGCLIALLVLVLIQAWCTLCCRSSNKSDHKVMKLPAYVNNLTNYIPCRNLCIACRPLFVFADNFVSIDSTYCYIQSFLLVHYLLL